MAVNGSLGKWAVGVVLTALLALSASAWGDVKRQADKVPVIETRLENVERLLTEIRDELRDERRKYEERERTYQQREREYRRRGGR